MADEPAATPGHRWVGLDLALLGLALVLVVVTVLTWGDGEDDGPDVDAAAARASAEQRAVTRAAGREVLAFLEVDHRDMAAVSERVLAGATGAFREEYAADLERLTRSVERRDAVVEASLRAVGAEALTGSEGSGGSGDVVVLVAADSLLRDDSTGEDGVLRRHRVRVTMTGSGQDWAVSTLELLG